jgi:predicted methyltransferase
MHPPLITSTVAKRLLEGFGRVSLDLGLSQAQVEFEEDRVLLPDGRTVKHSDLMKVAERENSVFFSEGDALYLVAISDSHFYKLVPTDRAPTLEIDGIRMHRTKGITPDLDAKDKISVLGVSGGRVLDTCTGLGYTAQAALARGAGFVTSIEIRHEVLRITRLNPWSQGVFEDRRIHLMLGDSFCLLDALPQEFFDYVIHDPPRFALAGHLYGQEFYHKLFDALIRGGELFHYTGEPGSRRQGINLSRGVGRRLKQTGFREVVYHEDIRGITCRKPLRLSKFKK